MTDSASHGSMPPTAPRRPGDAAVTSDRNGRIVFWNAGAERMFGYAAAEAVGQPLTLIIPNRFVAEHDAGLRRVRESGTSALAGQTLSLTAVRRGGAEFPIELTLETWIVSEHVFFTGAIRDLSASATHDESDDLYHAVAESLSRHGRFSDAAPSLLARMAAAIGCSIAAVWLRDPGSNRMRVDTFWAAEPAAVVAFESVTRQLTLPLGIGLPGRVWAEACPVWISDVTEESNFPRSTVGRQAGIRTAVAFPITNGTEVLGVVELFSTSSRPREEALLRVLTYIGGHIGLFVDRERAEAARRSADDRYRILFERNVAGVFRTTVAGRIVEVNDAVARAFGYDTAAELLGRSAYDLYADASVRDRILASLCAEGAGQHVEVRGRRRDGSVGWYLISIGATAVGDERFLQGTVLDITSQKQEHDALARTTALLKRAEELADIGSFEQDLESGRVFWSDAVYRLLLVDSRKDGLTLDEAMQFVVPEDRDLVQATLGKAAESGTIASAAFRVRRADGVMRQMIGRVAAEYDSSGQPVRLLGTIRDVSEDEAANQERDRLRHELERLRRISSLGHLAASMSHEFNNVLMSIQPHLEFIRRRAGGTPQLDGAFDHASQAIARGRRITSEILEYTRGASAQFEVIDARACFASFVAALSELPCQTTVEIRTPARNVWIRGDAARLHQVLTNLVTNARDAVRGTGTLRLSLEAAPRHDPGAEVMLVVEDSGPGIAAADRERIFEPFVSTKGARGTGLGLAVARQIVELHGGTLTLDSVAPEGARFVMRLREVAAPETAAPSIDRSAGAGLPRRVLLVEDDESVGAGIAAMLGLDGIDVEVVAQGGHALEAIGRFAPDVVLLDLGLPDMDGWDVLEMIRANHRSLPVVISSGHAFPDDDGRGVCVLRKPYSAADLLQTFSEATAL